MGLNEMVKAVEALVKYPEVKGETYLADWIADGDWWDMTPEQIATEWDNLSQQAENETTKEITFYVATNLEYFGDGATEDDVEDYAKFARIYLEEQGYDVEIEFVQHYPNYYGSDPRRDQDNLRERAWAAYLNSLRSIKSDIDDMIAAMK